MEVKLIDIVDDILKADRPLSDDTLLCLYSIFDKMLFSALQIIDKNSISKYIFHPSQRSIYVIDGRKGTKYLCLINGNYCSCPSFGFNVLSKQDSIYCKHQIASLISEILINTSLREDRRDGNNNNPTTADSTNALEDLYKKRIPTIEVPDTEYSNQIASIEVLSFKTPTHHHTPSTGTSRSSNYQQHHH